MIIAGGNTKAHQMTVGHLTLELLLQSSLLQNAVGRMTGENFVIDGKISPGNGRIPDFVITFARTVKRAAVLPKNFLHCCSVIGHGYTWHRWP